MNERQVATGLLLMEKNLAKSYAMGRLEASHEAGRNLLARLGEDSYELHDSIWEYLHHQGWYTVPEASEEMVQDAIAAWAHVEAPTS